MSYAVVWRYEPKGDKSRVLVGHPGTYGKDDAEAKEEGRRILADPQIETHHRMALMPLAVVETNTALEEKIQADCEEVEVGDELLFYDVGEMTEWKTHSWWPAA